MTDNGLMTLLVSGFNALLPVRVPFPVDVRQKYQPTQQGIKSGAAVYLFKVGDVRRGHVQRKDVYNVADGNFSHLESQWYETTIQVSALLRQNPAEPYSLTVGDVASIACGIIQSHAMMQRLKLSGVGVLRVDAIRNPFFVDDSERNEASPSFDFVLTHKRETIDMVPAVEFVEFNFARV
jgi:hypothetical protein